MAATASPRGVRSEEHQAPAECRPRGRQEHRHRHGGQPGPKPERRHDAEGCRGGNHDGGDGLVVHDPIISETLRGYSGSPSTCVTTGATAATLVFPSKRMTRTP